LALIEHGTILVIGQPGTGKSYLACYLTAHLAERGESVGLLNTDTGQASVGVPACLGLSLAPSWEKASALWFIGDTTPVGNLLPTVVGAGQLVRRARQAGAQTIIVDTSGLVEGPLGRVLKYHEAAATEANQIVAVQRAGELESLLVLLAGICPVIHRLTAVAQAQDRTPAERKAFRQARFQAHLQGGEVVMFPLDRLLGPDWLPHPPGKSVPFPTGTVVGLLDSQGFCLGLGLIEPSARPGQLAVFTARREPAAIVRLQVGKLRLSREGQELSM
jgi:polynucleotide 5'-kinase involved in rRNA processing